MTLEAIFFDFGNTLVFSPDSFAFNKRQGVQNVSDILVHSGYQIDLDHLYNCIISHRDVAIKQAKETGMEVPAFQWFKTAFTELGIGNVELAFVNRCVDSYYEPYIANREVLNYAPLLLENLHNHGFKLGLISNATNGLAIRRTLARFNLLSWFQTTIISSDVRYRKPNKEIFVLALTALQITDPTHAVMIGDRKSTDIAGANNAGMRAIHVTAIEHDDDIGPEPDASAKSLAEVEMILFSWAKNM